MVGNTIGASGLCLVVPDPSTLDRGSMKYKDLTTSRKE